VAVKFDQLDYRDYRQQDSLMMLIRSQLQAAVRHLEEIHRLAHTFDMDGPIEVNLLRTAIGTLKDVPKHGFKMREPADQELRQMLERGE